MKHTASQAEAAVAAVLDGARALAKEHGVVLAASASATYGDGKHEEMMVASVGAPAKTLDAAAVLAGALMAGDRGGLDAPSFRRSVQWGIENARELVRGDEGSEVA